MDGVRTNIAVSLAYLAAWIGGAGAVAIHNLMEDAATVEISRMQVWQWVHHQRDHRRRQPVITPELVRELVAEEADRLAEGADERSADALWSPPGMSSRRLPGRGLAAVLHQLRLRHLSGGNVLTPSPGIGRSPSTGSAGPCAGPRLSSGRGSCTSPMSIELDLTDPEAATFGSVTTHPVHQHRAGDLRRLPRPRAGHRRAQRGAPRPGRLAERSDRADAGCAAENTLTVAGPDGVRAATARDCTGTSTRTTSRPTSTRCRSWTPAPRWFAVLRPARPEGRVRARRPRRRRTGRCWATVPAARWSRGAGRSRPTGPLPTYFVTLVAGPYASVTRRARRASGSASTPGPAWRSRLEEAADDLLR